MAKWRKAWIPKWIRKRKKKFAAKRRFKLRVLKNRGLKK